jgi:hypothetical protein
MKALLIVCFVASGCAISKQQPSSDISPGAFAAMQQLHIGMTMLDAEAVMRPVCLDWGILSSSDPTGNGRLYFEVSPTQELYLDFGPWPDHLIAHIGTPEAKRHWRRDRLGGLIIR